MNQENRQKVLNYLAEQNTCPLYFNNYESNKEEFDPTKYPVESMVKRVLELSRSYASYNSDSDEFESSKNRWRSSLDIWRHIIYYYPTIEIFDVMHELHKLYLVDVNGQFCNDILRRTFRIILEGSCRCSTCMVNYMSAISMKSYTYDSRTKDEYDLDWEEWRDI